MLCCGSLVTLLEFLNSVGAASAGFFIPNPPSRGGEGKLEIVLSSSSNVHQ